MAAITTSAHVLLVAILSKLVDLVIVRIFELALWCFLLEVDW
jgi:hypothetical protein